MIIDTDDNIPWVELGKKNWCIDDDDDDQGDNIPWGMNWRTDYSDYYDNIPSNWCHYSCSLVRFWGIDDYYNDTMPWWCRLLLLLPTSSQYRTLYEVFI